MSRNLNILTPENAQNYNKYSYVLNNPLKYTDPSGYAFENWSKWQMSSYLYMRGRSWERHFSESGIDAATASELSEMQAWDNLIRATTRSGGGGELPDEAGPEAPEGEDGGDSEPGENKKIDESFFTKGTLAFIKYWYGDGSTVKLTDETFQDILSKYTVDEKNEERYIDFGGDYYLEAIHVGGNYASWIGNAFLIRDRENNIVGFQDTYDFDMGTKRSFLDQIVVGYVHLMSKINPFETTYYIIYY